MRVICESVYGASIPAEKRFGGEVDETCYAPLKTGEEYRVHAMMFVVDRVDFLANAGGTPIWAPGSLFKVVDANLPPGWGFCCTRSAAGYSELFEHLRISFLVGYSLLVSNYAHYAGVASRDDAEIVNFFRASYDGEV